MKPLHLLAQIVALLITFFAAPLWACGPWDINVYFSLPDRPGPSRDSFLQGQLGILDSGLAPAYRYVAYRHLAGLETDHRDVSPVPLRRNLESLSSLWPATPERADQDPVAAWREARAAVPGFGPIGWLSRDRQVRAENADHYYFSYFLNCLDDAFWNAERTLAARIERFGASSREVQAWITAQDVVFSNCGGGETMPAPLDETWDPLARADRAYQIAAAHFYAARYSDAAELFRTIARDDASPWRQLSAYLVARALIRDRQFAAAGEHLRAVIDDPELAEVHEPARGLLGYAALRDDPQRRRLELERRLLASSLDSPIGQDWIDYLWLLEQGAAQTEESSPKWSQLEHWLTAMADRTYDKDRPWKIAHDNWQTASEQPGPDAPWLVAALITADPDREGIEPLIDAAAGIEDSRLGLTVAYHRARLLAGMGRAEETRAIIDPFLEQPDDLSPADRNRLRILRAAVTSELDEYLRLLTLMPVGLKWEGDSDYIVAEGEVGYTHYRFDDPLLFYPAVELLNHALTTEELLEVAEDYLLPTSWRRRLALVVWTRAAVTGNDATALAAAPLVSSLASELAAEMRAFTTAEEADRQFQSAWTLSRFPGLTPVLRWNLGRETKVEEVDGLRDNGWCDGVLQIDGLPGQIVRTPEQIAKVQAELPELPAWPNYIGKVMLAHANSRPDDPRIPEALHRVVRATRIGCPIGGYGDISKAAFQRLHKRYPSSPWTEKTPYWFD